MTKKKTNHKYLSSLYFRVDEFLSHDPIDKDALADVIVSFCVVVEKILKIKLHKKNPLLVFDFSVLKADGVISTIALKKEKTIDTAKINEIINRFSLVFPKIFTSDEFQALHDVYVVRNFLVHGYKPDDAISFNPDDIVSKMGTIWNKASLLVIALLGKEKIKSNKPKRKYTAEELENVLKEEVLTKIKRNNPLGYTLDYALATAYEDHFSEKCPRCRTHGFKIQRNSDTWSSIVDDTSAVVFGAYSHMLPNYGYGGFYKCTKCGLELTEKEYEIAKNVTTLS